MRTTVPPSTPLAPPADRTDRLARVRADLARAERRLRRLRRRDTVGIAVSLGATSLSTVVAGSAAALNQAVATQGWRATCALAAVLAGVGAVATGLRQQLASGDRVARTASCVGRLRGLEFALSVGATSAEAADAQYRELLEQYADDLAADEPPAVR